jgi:ATP-binding cassette subfamily C protein CydD
MEGLLQSQQWTLFAALLVLVGIRAFLSWGRELAGFQAGVRVREDVRMALVEHIFHLGPSYTGQRKIGALSSAVMEQVEGLHGFFAHYLPQLALSVAVPVAILAFVFPISWAAGGVLLISAPLIPLFMILVGMGAESISQRHFQSLARMSAHFFDMLQGIATLKLLNRSRGEENAISQVSDAYRRKTMAVLRVAFLSSAVLEFFSSISIALVAVYLGMSYLGYVEFGAWGKPLTLAGGFFILLVAPEFYLPLRELGVHYHARAEALGAAREILNILTEKGQGIITGTAPFVFSEPLHIRCEDLHLAFDGGGRPVLNGVSFELNSGEQVALVGPSGVGKTTIVNLLLGFVQAERGRITVNNISLDRVASENWRRHLAWIGQHPVLLHGTIRDNIRMGRPDAPATAIEAAARAARVHEFAAKLPEGLDTRVGELGQALSRGQAQRVALARVFLKDAPLLLMDEPTAGLDTDNERLVMEAIGAFCHGRSLLMLTHRLIGLDKMDRILVMAGGTIVQSGTWSELKQAEGVFSRLLARRYEVEPYG